MNQTIEEKINPEKNDDINKNQEILEKANYCASCIKKPCRVGCPLNNDITGFIKLMKEEKYKEAYELLTETTVLSAVCGKICPHQKQCQGSCVKRIAFTPVEIGELESFIGDLSVENGWKITDKKIEKINKKVAVIGGGPAGLTCAAFLAKNGVDVTIYEKHDYLGGILEHGIPDFRLDKNLLKNVIDKILDLGVEVKLNQELGKDFEIEQIEKEYDAIFLGIGANISSKMRIEGEELEGVYGGNELLENKMHPDYHGKTIVVSGGGNVAMDVSRTVKRMGAERVIVVYRRSENEMPAEKKEIEEAKEEGIEFLFQNNILRIIGENKVEKIECIKTELVQKDGENRLSPVNIEGSNYYIDVDYVMMAVGSKAEESILKKLGLDLDNRGKIKIDENGQTSNKKIFAGGDLVGSIGTVAWASRDGRNAAYSILEFLKYNYK